MYIVVMINKDHALVTACRVALKEQFPNVQFEMRSPINTPGTFSIQLEGASNEDKPVAFAQGFAASWKHLAK